MGDVSWKLLIPRLSVLMVLFSVVCARRGLVDLNEENWRQVLKGEWMIKFHAPWCPACKDLKKTWSAFADWSQDLEITVASVDVTANPGLSGRFLVTALPTLYHVKNGVFRVYQGARDKDDFISFIEEKKWTSIDQLPTWKYPDSPQMAVVAMFFRMSMTVRDFHNYLVEQKGLPPVASYLCFGGATLLLGCILGFFIVCIIDCVFPANAPGKEAKKPQGGKEDKKQKKQQKEAKAKDTQSEGEGTQSEGSAEESTEDNKTPTRQRKGEKAGNKVANGKPAGSEGKKKK